MVGFIVFVINNMDAKNFWLLETFSGEYYFSSRDCYTGQKSEVSLKDFLKYKEKTDEKNNGRFNVFS